MKGLLVSLSLASSIWFSVSPTALAQSAAPSFGKRQRPPPTAVGAITDGATTASDDHKAETENIAKDASTEINVKNADIAAVVKIFSKKTRRNYILDDRVKGKVSIYLPGKVSTDESLRILESVLSFKGFTSVPIGENLWKIVPSREARQTTIPTVVDKTSSNPSAAVVTRLLHLKYVSADEMKQLLNPLISTDGLLNAYTGTNALIVIDSEDNIARIAKLVDEIDVPYSNRDMTIIPVTYADAVDLAQKLNDILGEGKGSDAKGSMGDPLLQNARMNLPPIPGAPPQGSGTAGGSTVGGRAKEPKIIPDERTNSIIVVADEDTTLRIRALISQLDSKLDLSGGKFYVYRCQHAKAQELAEVLSGLMGGGGGSSSGGSNRAASLTGAFNSDSGSGMGGSSNSKGSRSQNRTSGQKRTPGQSRNEGKSQGGAGTVSLGEDMSITADPATNSLIISASKADYQKIKTLIEKLDIKRRQVLVEAMILEVNIEDNQTLGTSWLVSTGGKDGGLMAKGDFNGDLGQMLKDPSKLSGFSMAAASSGTLTLPGGITVPTQAVLLSAIKSNTNVNVLSSPNILTTDNEQAEIVVGQNVPFLASKSTSGDNLNNTFNQIDRQDVGITLRITPQISSGDFVTLKVFTEVSRIIPSTQASDLGPSTTMRTSETTIITKDSQMIVIGGMIADDMTEAESGIPFLKDVPILGHLFRYNSQQKIKQNLLIFITPHVVRDQFDARQSTLDHRDTLEQIIGQNDVYPDRSEVLHDFNINRVTEGSLYDGQKPTTIRPSPKLPQPKVDQEATVQPSADQPDAPAPASPEAIELHVSAPEPQFIPQQSAHTRATRQAASVGPRYVVFRVAGDEIDSASLPFAVKSGDSNDAGQTVGIIVPPEADSSAHDFFRAGTSYSYTREGKNITLIPQGIFTSATEAAAFQPQIEDAWYTLSPYELLNLGRGPWSEAK